MTKKKSISKKIKPSPLFKDIVKKASKKNKLKLDHMSELLNDVKIIEKEIGIDDLNTSEGRANYRNKLAQDHYDGYKPEVKTTTFTSTTFDDIVSFPKYPVSKPGFHVVGKTSNVDLNEQVIKSFEKNDTISWKQLYNNLLSDLFRCRNEDLAQQIINKINDQNFPDHLKHTARKYFDKKFGTQPLSHIKLKKMEDEEFQSILDEDDRKLREELDLISIHRNLSNGSNEIEESARTFTKPNITNRDKINKSNKLFKDLASYVGEVTKEYWIAKQKLVLVNKFMEDFYSGKEFEFIENNAVLGLKEAIEQNVEESLNGPLNRNKYAQDVLNKVRNKDKNQK